MCHLRQIVLGIPELKHGGGSCGVMDYYDHTQIHMRGDIEDGS